ncbi:MAG: hypothetical protein ACPG7F_17825 [Aggregatilineales bacterium]
MRKLFFLILLLVLFSFSSVLNTQSETLDCSPDAINSAVSEVVTQFENNVTRISGSAQALREATLLSLAIDAIHDACAYQTFIENGGEETLNWLQSGGYVLYTRHTHTDRSRGDTSPEQCATQRILSDRGREEAAMIAPYFAMLDIPIDSIISTEYCRVRETAQLAFGDIDSTIPRADMAGRLPGLLSTAPPDGTNTLIVAHIGELSRVTPYNLGGTTIGADGFEEGDTLIFQPLDDGDYELVGRVDLEDWRSLALLYRQITGE